MKPSTQGSSATSRAIRRSTQLRSDAGAAAVELAIVLPILLALIFGMVNFGFIFAAQISLNSSARDAARAGVVNPLLGSAQTCSYIATSARGNAATIGLDTTKISITVTGPGGTCTSPANGGAATGDVTKTVCTQPIPPVAPQLKVVLSYTAVSPVPLVPPSSVALSATGVFQCEYM